VFGDQSGDVIGDIAREAALDVVQLHGDCSAAVVRAVRKRFMGEVWRVVRVRGDVDETSLRDAGADVDAVVVDALVDSALGGTGVAVNWERLAAAFGRVGRPARLVLAGGLRPENVVRAVGVVAPDVVDVSSGVESSVGIKDHALMRAFADAAARGGE
jgi:phosphoribosylanthranilate isomerase